MKCFSSTVWRKFHRDQNFVASFCCIKKNDGFEVVSHSHPSPVEIDDFHCRTVGVILKIEPHLYSGEIVSIERFRDFDPTPIPQCVVRTGAVRSNDLPGTIVKIDRFALGNVAGMNFPFFFGKVHQRF